MEDGRTIVMVAADMLQGIVEGRTTVVERLAERAEHHRIVLLSTVLSDGLHRADAATADGLLALARLICLAEIETYSGVAHQEATANAVLPPDTLLACLLGTIPERTLNQMVVDWPKRGVSLIVHDVSLVAALQCVRDGDRFDTESFAILLNASTILMADPEESQRSEWQVDDGFVWKYREKAPRLLDLES